MNNKLCFALVATAILSSAAPAWEAEGISEDCSLDYTAQKQQAESNMNTEARKSCKNGWPTKQSRTHFHRYLADCPEKVYAASATADFTCFKPF